MAPLSPPDPPLSDGVVTLRDFRDTDADAIAAMMDEPEIARWTRAPSPYGLSDALEWLTTRPAMLRRGAELSLAIADAGSDRLLGSMGLRPRDDGRGEFGYVVAAWARRRGVGSRALRLYARYAFEVMGLERLEILVQPANAASLAMASKAGFRREGLLRSHSVGRDGRVDMVMLALLPGELGR